MRTVILILGLFMMAPSFASSSKPLKTWTEARVIHEATKILMEDIGPAFDAREWPGIMLKAPDNGQVWNGPYLVRVPQDPWGNEYVLKFETNELKGVYSFGLDGIDNKGEYDDISSWQGYEESIYFPNRMGEKLVVLMFALVLIILLTLGVYRIMSSVVRKNNLTKQ